MHREQEIQKKGDWVSKKKADSSGLPGEKPTESRRHDVHSSPDTSLPPLLSLLNTVLQTPCCLSADQAC